YEKNTVGVLYKIKNGKYRAKLTLAPIMNFRDFHTMNTAHNYQLRQIIKENKVKLIIDNKFQIPIYINLSEGKYITHEHYIFKNMYYVEKENRKKYTKEDNIVSVVYEE